jgi:PPOX class probable F420-dependent enzyme
MTSGRDAVKLTDQEVDELLADNLKVQVASIGPDGVPHLSTLFYIVRDGRIVFWTYGRSQKIKNLERDPRVSVLVEDGVDYFELRGVSITGKAELVTEESRIREIGSAVATRMAHGADLGDLGREMVERQVAKRWGVVVEPVKVATWDHRKMAHGS